MLPLALNDRTSQSIVEEFSIIQNFLTFKMHTQPGKPKYINWKDYHVAVSYILSP